MTNFNSRKITIALLVLFAGFCFWQALPKSVSQNAADSFLPSATAEIGPSFSTKPSIETRAIETIRVGQRVLARNPEVERAERLAWGPEPDFSQWLHLTLEMPKEDGSTLTIQMLRPDEWVDAQLSYVIDESGNGKAESRQQEADTPPLSPLSAFDGPLLSAPLSPLRPVFRDILLTSLAVEEAGAELVGMTVQMDLPELGLTGEAIVTDIQGCSEIEPRASGDDDRRVVTATFHHSSGDVIDLVLADEFSDRTTPDLNPETETLKPVGEAGIGTTSNHPFWSVDRQEYVQAGLLEIGERLQTLHGDTKTVVSNLPRPGPRTDVYNLEVHAEHVYFVGKDGVLVHNAYNTGATVKTTGNLRTETLADGVTKRFYFKSNGRWKRVRGAKVDGIQKHHVFPQEAGLQNWFKQKGINIDAYTLPIRTSIHQRIHKGYGGGIWNDTWKAFKKANPNASPEMIYKQAGKMIHDFDIDGIKVVPYR